LGYRISDSQGGKTIVRTYLTTFQHKQKGGIMTILKTTLIGLLAVFYAGSFQSVDWIRVRQSLVEAERAFASRALDIGIRDSFMQYFAEDAIILAPTPTSGQKYYHDEQASSDVLTWRPSYVDLSSAGDLGLSSGPWEYREKDRTAEPVAYGHFVSIWKKQKNGEWKVVLDAGCSHPRPEPAADSVSFRKENVQEGDKQMSGDARKEMEKLMDADRAFSRMSASTGFATAFANVALPDVRLHRMKAQPAFGKENALVLLAGTSSRLSWEPQGGDVAGSGDLGYTYGVAQQMTESADTVRFGYARVWRRTGNDGWKVLVDVVRPVPKKVATTN
jgi:ketosteroid isomerase-like protein